VQRRIVIDAALIGIRRELEQQTDDIGDIRPAGGPEPRQAARQRCNQRRKPSIVRWIGIGADLKQSADDRNGL
jgi:hypothetical protein